MDYRRIRGKITELYGTQMAFAKALGMSYTALNQRLSGKLEWKTQEIVLACKMLGIPLSEVYLYFFTPGA